MNLLGCPFCTKCKENKFQSTGARKTARKTRAETAPATCRNKSKKHRFWPPKWLQHPYKIAPRGLSEAAGAPRRTQEQQTATKKAPRAIQERSKSTRKRFSRFSWRRGGPRGVGGGRPLRHGQARPGTARNGFSPLKLPHRESSPSGKGSVPKGTRNSYTRRFPQWLHWGRWIFLN